MRGRPQAISVTVLFAVISLLALPLASLAAPLAPLAFPLALFAFLSGAVVGLSTLRYGEMQGVVVGAGASALYALLCVVLFRDITIAAGVILVIWAPTLVLCIGLRATSSTAVALTLGAFLAIAGLLVFHLAVGDATQWWRDIFDEFIARLLGGLAEKPERNIVLASMQRLDQLAPKMTSWLAASILYSTYITTLLARWFHSILDNPGGFGMEFRSLRLDPRVAIILAVVACGLGLLTGDFSGGPGGDVLHVAVVLYSFQGIAIAHSAVAQLGASVGWLILLYILLIIAVEYVSVFLAITGFLDSWLKVRTRLGKKSANS